MQKTSVFTLTADLMSALSILCHIHMKDCKWGHVTICPAWLSAWMWGRDPRVDPCRWGCAWALEHSTGCPGSRHGTAQHGTAQGSWQAKWSSDTFLVCTLPRFLPFVKDRTTDTHCNYSVHWKPTEMSGKCWLGSSESAKSHWNVECQLL